MTRGSVDQIVEIGIDQSERLFIRPTLCDYDFVYRAAMEVYWDNAEQYLHSPKPREWTYADWYSQIIAAVWDEYGRRLSINDSTVWTNTSAELKAQIEDLHRANEP